MAPPEKVSGKRGFERQRLHLTPHKPNGILQCPNEVILKILDNMHPRDKLSFSRVSKECYLLANDPMQWIGYCRSFKYWPEQMSQELQRYRPTVDWKRIALRRQQIEEQVWQIFTAIITRGGNHDAELYSLSTRRHFARDFLTRQRNTPDDDPMVLCRRWWSQEALNAVHRGLVLDEWGKAMLAAPQSRTLLGLGYTKHRLESFLYNLGMATIQQPDAELEGLSSRLDEKACDFLARHPGCMELDAVTRAQLLLSWFNAHDIFRHPHHLLSDPRECPSTCVGHAPFGQKTKTQRLVCYTTITRYLFVLFIALAQRLDIPAYFTFSSTSIVVPCTNKDNPTFDIATTPRHVDISPCLIIAPGVSSTCTLVNKLEDGTNEELMVMTEDEFILCLLDALHGWLQNDGFVAADLSDDEPVSEDVIDTSYSDNNEAATDDVDSVDSASDFDGLSLQILHSTWHILRCGEVLLAPVLTQWQPDIQESFLDAAVDSMPSDARTLRQHVQNWLDHRAPPGFANTEGARGVMEILLGIEQKIIDQQMRFAVENNMGGYVKDSHIRVGDVVKVPATVFRHPVPQGVTEVVGVVIKRVEVEGPGVRMKSCLYTCLFPVDPLNRGPPVYRDGHYGRFSEQDLTLINDPHRVPRDIFFPAGQYFQRFDPETCRFIPIG